MYKREGSRFYQYSLKNPATGRYLSARSTRTTSRAEADKIAREAARLRDLEIDPSIITKDTLVTKYVEAFYDENNSAYILEMKAHNPNALQSDHIRTQRSYFIRYVKPLLGKIRLGELTPSLIKAIQRNIRTLNNHLKPQTINAIVRSLTKPIKEACKNWIIKDDPTGGLKIYTPDRKTAGIFVLNEVRSLVQTEWIDHKAKIAFKLSLITGMRSGEIRALRWQDFVILGGTAEPVVTIKLKHALSKTHGLKSPKNGESREVPIPVEFYKELEQLRHFQAKPIDYVFTHSDGIQPMSSERLILALRRALTSIGISEKAQNERKLCYHSTRHFFNTYMATRIDKDILRKVIGHSSQEMTDHYFHTTEDQFVELREAQSIFVLSYLTASKEVSA